MVLTSQEPRFRQNLRGICYRFGTVAAHQEKQTTGSNQRYKARRDKDWLKGIVVQNVADQVGGQDSANAATGQADTTH